MNCTFLERCAFYTQSCAKKSSTLNVGSLLWEKFCVFNCSREDTSHGVYDKTRFNGFTTAIIRLSSALLPSELSPNENNSKINSLFQPLPPPSPSPSNSFFPSRIYADNVRWKMDSPEHVFHVWVALYHALWIYGTRYTYSNGICLVQNKADSRSCRNRVINTVSGCLIVQKTINTFIHELFIFILTFIITKLLKFYVKVKQTSGASTSKLQVRTETQYCLIC